MVSTPAVATDPDGQLNKHAADSTTATTGAPAATAPAAQGPKKTPLDKAKEAFKNNNVADALKEIKNIEDFKESLKRIGLSLRHFEM